MMSFGEAVKTCFKKYVDFSGRARRSEYWWFQVLHLILCACMTAVCIWKITAGDKLEAQVSSAIFDQEKMDALMAQANTIDNTFYLLAGLICIIWLVLVLPGLAVTVRRLHDIGKSGWFILLCFIPYVNFIGGIVIFIFTVMDSKPEENKFGPSPKYIS